MSTTDNEFVHNGPVRWFMTRGEHGNPQPLYIGVPLVNGDYIMDEAICIDCMQGEYVTDDGSVVAYKFTGPDGVGHGIVELDSECADKLVDVFLDRVEEFAEQHGLHDLAAFLEDADNDDEDD